MQVIRETVNAPGCVTSVFQPSTNLKTRKLHSRGVGSLYCLLLPKRIKSGVIELQCDLRELYFSNLKAAVTKLRYPGSTSGEVLPGSGSSS